MSGYKLFLLVFGWGLLLVILTVLQISILNSLFGGPNLILLLLLTLVVTKKNQTAIFLTWIGGFLISSSHFSKFGLLSATFLILTVVLITLHKTIFFTLKNENVIFMGIIAVFLYHFLEWLLINLTMLFNAHSYESLSFQLLNRGIFFELITTVIFLLIIVHGLKLYPAVGLYENRKI